MAMNSEKTGMSERMHTKGTITGATDDFPRQIKEP